MTEAKALCEERAGGWKQLSRQKPSLSPSPRRFLSEGLGQFTENDKGLAWGDGAGTAPDGVSLRMRKSVEDDSSGGHWGRVGCGTRRRGRRGGTSRQSGRCRGRWWQGTLPGDCHQLRSSPAPSSPLCPAGSFPPTFLPTALGLGQLPQTPMGNLGHSPEALGS